MKPFSHFNHSAHLPLPKASVQRSLYKPCIFTIEGFCAWVTLNETNPASMLVPLFDNGSWAVFAKYILGNSQWCTSLNIILAQPEALQSHAGINWLAVDRKNKKQFIYRAQSKCAMYKKVVR